MNNIIVFGGSGFIGTRLIKRLINAKYSVTIADKNTSQEFPKLCEEVDIRNRDEVIRLCKEKDIIINLAAEHKDNVKPVSLYDEVNVNGAENVCEAAEKNNIRQIIFTSTVAVYGFAPPDTDECGSLNPFNDYGRTKMLAEEVYTKWQKSGDERSLSIVRPTVVFGENNRGNVYNLLKQISSGNFLMIGNGENVKSMAYVENVAAFIEYLIGNNSGKNIYNYVDKPDFTMNQLVETVDSILNDQPGKKKLRIPYFLGYIGGMFFDLLSLITKREYPVSSIRVKKFCATTQFSSQNIGKSGFTRPIPIEEGLKKMLQYEFK